MVPNNTTSNRRRMNHHFDAAVVVVCSAEVKLRRGEAPRYLEAKINQLHKRLQKTTRIIEQGCCDEKTVVTVITPTVCSSSSSCWDSGRGGLFTSINISHTSSGSMSTISAMSAPQASSLTSNRSWPTATKRQAQANSVISPSRPGPGSTKMIRQQQHICVDDDDWGHFVDTTQMDLSSEMARRPAPPSYRHFLRREIQSTTDARQYQPP
jgi:hypothetical protein